MYSLYYCLYMYIYRQGIRAKVQAEWSLSCTDDLPGHVHIVLHGGNDAINLLGGYLRHITGQPLEDSGAFGEKPTSAPVLTRKFLDCRFGSSANHGASYHGGCLFLNKAR